MEIHRSAPPQVSKQLLGGNFENKSKNTGGQNPQNGGEHIKENIQKGSLFIYAHIEIVVTLIVVNLISFLVITRTGAGRFGRSLDTAQGIFSPSFWPVLAHGGCSGGAKGRDANFSKNRKKFMTISV